MLSSGMISLSDFSWQEGLSSWLPLHQILNVPPPVPQGPPSPPLYPATTSASTTSTGTMFLYIPTSRLIVMSIVSLGLYQAYWVYRNWRYLKERDGLRIRPFWRGVFDIFFIPSLFSTIKNDAPTNQIQPATFSPGVLATGWVILWILGYVLGSVPDRAANLVGIIISVPSFCFLLPVQNHINAVNEASPIRPSYYGWSSGHIVCLGVGIIMWILILVALTQ